MITVADYVVDFLAKKKIKNTEYFNKTDITFSGFIKRLDKVKLPVHFTHHTIQDYFNSFAKAKLNKVVKVEELKVTSKHDKLILLLSIEKNFY